MELTGDVTVDIDELDLTAVPPARRYQVAATFERELRRLIAERPIDPARVRRLGTGHLPTLAIDVDLAANPVIVGAAIAHSVVEAMR
jgi:hypothetical protein